MHPLMYKRFNLSQGYYKKTNINSAQLTIRPKHLRCVLSTVRARNDIIKADFMRTKINTFTTKMKIGIQLEELK